MDQASVVVIILAYIVTGLAAFLYFLPGFILFVVILLLAGVLRLLGLFLQALTGRLHSR